MMAEVPDVARTLQLPSEEDLLAALRQMASQSEAVALALAAVETGVFVHPDGRLDALEDVSLLPAQLGLLIHLLGDCNKELSLEIGFGMGSSATVVLGARRFFGRPFEHIIFDHAGLPSGRGEIVADYLREQFGAGFVRNWTTSQVGLAKLLDERGPRVAGLVFIDGYHTFEAVMTDFYFADQLCSVGGYIVFDDAAYPAIETVVEYIAANRSNYAIARFPVENTVVLKKFENAELAWGQFRPFTVPQRLDWTPVEGVAMPVVRF
jgi:hypothetical protein